MITPNYPVTGATTRLVMTARLRASTWLRQRDPLMVVATALLIGAALAGLWIEREQLAQLAAQPAPSVSQDPIVVFRDRVLVATPTLGLPQLPTEQPAAAVVEVAQPAPVEPTPAPAAPEQPAEEPAELSVMGAQAQPEPTVETRWEGDTFVVNGNSVPTVAPEMIGKVDSQGWVCGTKYGDWRDTNPMYVHAECYK